MLLWLPVLAAEAEDQLEEAEAEAEVRSLQQEEDVDRSQFGLAREP